MHTKKESDSTRLLRSSARVRNDLETARPCRARGKESGYVGGSSGDESIRPHRTRGKRYKYVESSSDDSTSDPSEDSVEDNVTNM